LESAGGSVIAPGMQCPIKSSCWRDWLQGWVGVGVSE